MESQFAASLSKSPRADHTSFAANGKRDGKIIKKESDRTSEKNLFLFGSLSKDQRKKKLISEKKKFYNKSNMHKFVCLYHYFVALYGKCRF